MSTSKNNRTDDQSWMDLRKDLAILGLELEHQIPISVGGCLDDQLSHIGGKYERTTTILELLKEVISSAPLIGESTLIEVRTTYEYNEVDKILQALLNQGYLTEAKESYCSFTYRNSRGMTQYLEHGRVIARFKITR